MEGMLVADSHQCAYGQTSIDPDGFARLAKKPTGWMTNSPCIAEAVSRRCSNERVADESKHHALLMGGRASATERYPSRLVTAVLRALRAQLVLRGTVGALDAGETVEEEDVVSAAAKGGPYREYFDEATGQPFDQVGVEKAREEDMRYMRQRKVFDYVPEEVAL